MGGLMKVRKVSLTKQIIFVLAVLLLIGDILIGVVCYNRVHALFIRQVQQNAMDLAKCAAMSVDVEAFKDTVQNDDENYVKVLEALQLYKHNTTLEYVYSFKLNEEGNAVFAVDADDEDPAIYGEEYGTMLEGMDQAFKGETAADKEPTSDEWGTYISAYSPIMDGESVIGIVGVDVSYSSVQAAIRQLLINLIIICAIVFVLLFVVLIVIGQKMKKGFVTLDNKIAELADGSGDLRKKIDIKSGDEFEALGNTINIFIGQLEKLINEVANSSNSNAQGIKDINNNTISISANMQECSASTENVSLQLGHTAENVEELASNIDFVSEGVVEASKRARKAAELAISHKAESEEQISSIKDDIERMIEQAKAVEQVQKINEQIMEIVNQTRILSINAQIEAARAGEFGRGFAVVAKQVAKLSEDISVSVVDIGEINDQVLLAMKDMVTYLNNMTDYLNVSVASDYEAFAEIGKDFGDTTELIQGQMQSLKEQSADIAVTVSGVSNSINDISRAVSDTAEQIEELCNSTVDMSDGIDKLLEIEILKQ